MIPKRTTAAFWDNDLLTSHVLDISSKGVDKCQLEKFAADTESDWMSSVKPEKGFSFVHLISNGAGEYYGENKNRDYYNESACLYEFPHPKKGIDKVAQLDGGLKEYHKTYMQLGGVYKNHRNSRKTDPATGKPFEKLGEVVAETYNDKLHRGELIIKLPENNTWRDTLEKIANEEPVCWSVGASVPFDICGLCGNRAKSRKDYCEHLRSYEKTAEDGNGIFAINDRTYYHDISDVGLNPAMKIAYTLEKVAAGFKPKKPEFEVEGLWLPTALVEKMYGEKQRNRYELMQKLAELEESNEGDKLASGFRHSSEELTTITNKLKNIDWNELTTILAKEACVLPVDCFCDILIGSSEKTHICSGQGNWRKAVPEKLRNIFSNILEDSEKVAEVLTDGHYSPGMVYADRQTSELVRGLSDSLSISTECVRRRIIQQAISDEPMHAKEAYSLTEGDHRIAEAVATEYAKYQLAFLAKQPTSDCAIMLAAQNRAR